MTDYQRDIIRKIMNEELQKSSAKKKLLNSNNKKNQFFSLNSVYSVVSETSDLPVSIEQWFPNFFGILQFL